MLFFFGKRTAYLELERCRQLSEVAEKMGGSAALLCAQAQISFEVREHAPKWICPKLIRQIVRHSLA